MNAAGFENAIAYDRHPDFLQRFVPTPYAGRTGTGRIAIAFETNDVSCLRLIEKRNNEDGSSAAYFYWKIIRDVHSRGEFGRAVKVSSGDGNVVVVTMGPGCLAGIDAERRELLAFIGMDVDDRTMDEEILPLFFRLTAEAIERNCSEDIVQEEVVRPAAIHD